MERPKCEGGKELDMGLEGIVSRHRDRPCRGPLGQRGERSRPLAFRAAHSMMCVLLIALVFSTEAFAQGASPKPKRATVGTKPLVQIKPSAPAGCKLVGTVKGTKLWAGDCIPNEMRGGSTVPETDAPTPPSSPSPEKE